jgi:colanic acid/amylovoran biosynthesis glycosyltransferase
LAVLLRELEILRGPILTAFHVWDLSLYPRRHGSAVYRRLFRSGDLFLPICERWKSKLIDLGCPREKTLVHRMGINPREFARARCWVRPGEPIRILTIGRLVEKKGIAYGIEAVSQLIQQRRQVEYRIIGDGRLKESLQALIRERGVEDQIKLLGWKNREETRELLGQSDILLTPSVTGNDGDEEGIPVVLMEAAAHGLPLVSTHHSAIPELVRDGENGYLVPEKDAQAISDKLVYLIDRRDSWATLGAAGRRHIEAHYDIHKLNDRLAQIYEQMANWSANCATVL